jgi:uncharacterized metal-binding protein
MKPRQFTVAFKCSNCPEVGVRTWTESASESQVAGEGRTLVSVTQGFHIETGRTESGEPLIVCDACDQIQPD